MTSLLLAVIYLAFISLGLPDSLLGAAWPSIYPEFGVDISLAGVISMVIAGGTIVSSLLSARLIRRFGTAAVTVASVFMTAAALFGFSTCRSVAALCLWGIPYGLGAGSVDAGLNNYVALHCKPRHMSWLHCFWGVGATLGPYILSLCITGGYRWTGGFRAIGYIQTALVLCLLLSLPLWKRVGNAEKDEESAVAALGLREIFALPGAASALAGYLCYCALETSAGLWASSYMALYKGVDAGTAASWASLFYLGITAGRFLSGFLAEPLGDRRMVRIGLCVIGAGIVLLLLPAPTLISLIGLCCVGLGCAPVYPSLLHETPRNFGQERSQAMMGVSMASAYFGSSFMPPLFGLIAQYVDIALYPVYLGFFLVVAVIMTERTAKICG